jgi:hypothetical protein
VPTRIAAIVPDAVLDPPYIKQRRKIGFAVPVTVVSATTAERPSCWITEATPCTVPPVKLHVRNSGPGVPSTPPAATVPVRR